jgi:hypothetical protein
MRTMLAAFVGGIIGTVFTSMLVLAWAGPSMAPPNGNVDAPINVGIVDQIKNAGLGLNSLAVFGNAFISGASRYINFGTTTATGSSGYGIRDNNGVMEVKDAGGEWISLTSGAGASGNNLTISSDAQNVNLYVLAGSPATAGTYTITINPGWTVSSGSTANAAITTGTWPAGSIVKLINNGTIVGRGGDGGAGSNGEDPYGPGNPGGAGGPAISLTYDLTIDNTNGNIFGGGGGGGGGGTGWTYYIGYSGGAFYHYGGSGGGGGRGKQDSVGGGGGYAGTGGTFLAAGSGGATYAAGGAGGTGGDWAAAGSAGASGTSGNGYPYYGPGGAGGAAGKAINLNGRSVTWLGGNNSTQVKGAVQ